MELEKNDIGVGIFVILAGVVIVGTLIAIAQGRFGEATPLVARFDSISQIQAGTPVVLRGYRVGEVKRIVFFPQPDMHFDVHFIVTPDIQLRQGTRAVITSTNMIGDNYVLLDVSAADGELLEANEVIAGDSSQQVSDLMGRVNGVLNGAQRTVDRLSAALRSADPGEGTDLDVHADRSPLAEITTTVRELSGLLVTLNRVVTETQPAIARTAAVAEGGIRTAEWTSAQAGSLLVENREEIAHLIASLDSTSRNMNDLIVEVHGIATDNRDEIAGTLTELEKTSTNLARLSGDLADHPWKLLFR